MASVRDRTRIGMTNRIPGIVLDTRRAPPLHSRTQERQNKRGRVMRRFLAGLLLGLASMYWYAYQKDAFIDSVKDWFADASADPGAREKLDKMISRK